MNDNLSFPEALKRAFLGDQISRPGFGAQLKITEVAELSGAAGLFNALDDTATPTVPALVDSSGMPAHLGGIDVCANDWVAYDTDESR